MALPKYAPERAPRLIVRTFQVDRNQLLDGAEEAVHAVHAPERIPIASKARNDKTATVYFEVLNDQDIIAKDSCRIDTRDTGRGGHSGAVKLVLWRDELASATKLRTTMTTVDY